MATKREVFDFLFRVYPQGNPFLNFAECFKSVNAKFGVNNKKKFSMFIYRSSRLFKEKAKGKRVDFWKVMEKSGNLDMPFEAGNYYFSYLNF